MYMYIHTVFVMKCRCINMNTVEDVFPPILRIRLIDCWVRLDIQCQNQLQLYCLNV